MTLHAIGSHTRKKRLLVAALGLVGLSQFLMGLTCLSQSDVDTCLAGEFVCARNLPLNAAAEPGLLTVSVQPAEVFCGSGTFRNGRPLVLKVDRSLYQARQDTVEVRCAERPGGRRSWRIEHRVEHQAHPSLGAGELKIELYDDAREAAGEDRIELLAAGHGYVEEAHRRGTPGQKHVVYYDVSQDPPVAVSETAWRALAYNNP
ncbi:MAG: hypothetical protein EA397_19760 [Deltaproteobacteria bacterium]|nr:MAG: hypothetical protein EA397_19760 [Deltaproteobacteria bacterium]